MSLEKYQGIIPAFYACYDAEGNIDTTAVRALTRYLMEKGVNGLYVGGSSGECIYQSVSERKLVLEHVMAEAKGKIVISWEKVPNAKKYTVESGDQTNMPPYITCYMYKRIS